MLDWRCDSLQLPCLRTHPNGDPYSSPNPHRDGWRCTHFYLYTDIHALPGRHLGDTHIYPNTDHRSFPYTDTYTINRWQPAHLYTNRRRLRGFG